MKKLDLGQSLALLANIGVIGGILLLAYELRQNTQAIRVTASQDMASELAQFNHFWTDPGLAGIRLKSETEGYESLSELEKIQMRGINQSFLLLHQNLYYQFQAGSLDPVLWSGRHQQLVNLFASSDSFLENWQMQIRGFDIDFREYIENIIIPEAVSGSRE